MQREAVADVLFLHVRGFVQLIMEQYNVHYHMQQVFAASLFFGRYYVQDKINKPLYD